MVPAVAGGGVVTVAVGHDFIDKKKDRILTIAPYAPMDSGFWILLARREAMGGDFCITAISGNDPRQGPGVRLRPIRAAMARLESVTFLASSRAIRRPGVGGEACL
jgi:hypothetical protein